MKRHPDGRTPRAGASAETRRLRQALAMMAEGLALQADNLRRAFPEESEEERQARLRRWMLREP